MRIQNGRIADCFFPVADRDSCWCSSVSSIRHSASSECSGRVGGMERGANQARTRVIVQQGRWGAQSAARLALAWGVPSAVSTACSVTMAETTWLCQQRFGSYDVGSGTYLGHDGRRIVVHNPNRAPFIQERCHSTAPSGLRR